MVSLAVVSARLPDDRVGVVVVKFQVVSSLMPA